MHAVVKRTLFFRPRSLTLTTMPLGGRLFPDAVLLVGCASRLAGSTFSGVFDEVRQRHRLARLDRPDTSGVTTPSRAPAELLQQSRSRSTRRLRDTRERSTDEDPDETGLSVSVIPPHVLDGSGPGPGFYSLSPSSEPYEDNHTSFYPDRLTFDLMNATSYMYDREIEADFLDVDDGEVGLVDAANGSEAHVAFPYLNISSKLDYTDELREHLRLLNVKEPKELGWRHWDSTETRPLLWLHIHKEAGTFACLAAVVNGERIVAPSVNCNWKAFDLIWQGTCNATVCDGNSRGGVGSRNFRPTTCQSRALYFARGNYTFGAIEREFHKEDLCPDFRYGTALREPLAALASKVVFDTKNLYATAASYGVAMPEQKVFELGWFKEFLNVVFNSSSEDAVYSDPTEAVYGLPAWKLLDNYKIRAVLGDDAFNVGPGQINVVHLRKAIERLNRFDFIKIIDRPNAGEWNGTSRTIRWDAGIGQRYNSHPHEHIFDEEVRDRLLDINKYDVALFNHYAGYLNVSQAGLDTSPFLWSMEEEAASSFLEGEGESQLPSGMIKAEADASARLAKRKRPIVEDMGSVSSAFDEAELKVLLGVDGNMVIKKR